MLFATSHFNDVSDFTGQRTSKETKFFFQLKLHTSIRLSCHKSRNIVAFKQPFCVRELRMARPQEEHLELRRDLVPMRDRDPNWRRCRWLAWQAICKRWHQRHGMNVRSWCWRWCWRCTALLLLTATCIFAKIVVTTAS